MAYTIPQYQAKLKELRANKKGLNAAIQKPFRKKQKLIQSALIAEYWKSPVGAHVWKWRQDAFSVKGGPTVKLGPGKKRKLAAWDRSSGAWVALLNIPEGTLAAAVEGGGRLKSHVFWNRGSREPGMVVPAMPVFNRVIDKNWSDTVKVIEEGFVKYVKELQL